MTKMPIGFCSSTKMLPLSPTALRESLEDIVLFNFLQHNRAIKGLQHLFLIFQPSLITNESCMEYKKKKALMHTKNFKKNNILNSRWR